MASNIIGGNKSEIPKEAFLKPEPIVGFVKHHKKSRFYEKIMFASHLSTLNL